MSRDSDTRNVNSGSAAAALGLAVAVDDIENVGNDTNSYNDTNSNNDTDNVNITKNDNDTYTKNDNDTITKTVSVSKSEVEDSYNQDNDTITKTVSVSKSEVEDSYNQDNDVRDSYNTKDSYNATDIDTTVDVSISDAFKKIEDSYNSDDDWLELDHLNFDVLNAVGAGTLSGDGNDAMFNISQVSEMTDNDKLYRPEVENDAGFGQHAHADGGDANGAEDVGDRSSGTASADGVANLEAFTQNIVMGANIQYNNIDMSVVGGDSTVTDGSDIS
jgi:hypothetical protein